MPSVMIYVRESDHARFKELYNAKWLHEILNEKPLEPRKPKADVTTTKPIQAA